MSEENTPQYKMLTEQDQINIREVRRIGYEFIAKLEELGNTRELAIAKTKIEEALMWTVKHITS